MQGCRAFASGFDGLERRQGRRGGAAAAVTADDGRGWVVERSQLFAELHDQNRFGTLHNGRTTNYVALLLQLPPDAEAEATQGGTLWLASNIGVGRGEDAMSRRLSPPPAARRYDWEWRSAQLCVRSVASHTVSRLEASAPAGGVTRDVLSARGVAAAAA